MSNVQAVPLSGKFDTVKPVNKLYSSSKQQFRKKLRKSLKLLEKETTDTEIIHLKKAALDYLFEDVIVNPTEEDKCSDTYLKTVMALNKMGYKIEGEPAQIPVDEGANEKLEGIGGMFPTSNIVENISVDEGANEELEEIGETFPTSNIAEDIPVHEGANGELSGIGGMFPTSNIVENISVDEGANEELEEIGETFPTSNIAEDIPVHEGANGELSGIGGMFPTSNIAEDIPVDVDVGANEEIDGEASPTSNIDEDILEELSVFPSYNFTNDCETTVTSEKLLDAMISNNWDDNYENLFQSAVTDSAAATDTIESTSNFIIGNLFPFTMKNSATAIEAMDSTYNNIIIDNILFPLDMEDSATATDAMDSHSTSNIDNLFPLAVKDSATATDAMDTTSYIDNPLAMKYSATATATDAMDSTSNIDNPLAMKYSATAAATDAMDSTPNIDNPLAMKYSATAAATDAMDSTPNIDNPLATKDSVTDVTSEESPHNKKSDLVKIQESRDFMRRTFKARKPKLVALHTMQIIEKYPAFCYIDVVKDEYNRLSGGQKMDKLEQELWRRFDKILEFVPKNSTLITTALDKYNKDANNQHTKKTILVMALVTSLCSSIDPVLHFGPRLENERLSNAVLTPRMDIMGDPFGECKVTVLADNIPVIDLDNIFDGLLAAYCFYYIFDIAYEERAVKLMEYLDFLSGIDQETFSTDPFPDNC